MVDFDASNWTDKEWIALHPAIIFPLFGNIICIYYFFQMYKYSHSNNEILAKHIQVRHRKLFIAHLLICYYWFTFHPLIAFIMVLCNVSVTFMFCYGYFVLSVMFLIWISRMWLLYWDYTFSSLQVKLIWRKHINDKSNSFFINHPKWGRIEYIIVRLMIPLFVLSNALLYFIAYDTNLGILFHIIGVSYFSILFTFLNILCIQLHRKHILDNYSIRKEFTYLNLIYAAPVCVLVIPYFAVSDNFVRMYLIGDGVMFAECLTIVIISKIILNDVTIGNIETNLMEQEFKPQTKIIEILQDPTGINTFAEWLVGEFCVESLLFTIEVCQFRRLLRFYIQDNYADHQFDDIGNLYFELAPNIPLCETINSSKTLSLYDYSKIAEKICTKFIRDEFSEFAINISYDQRQKLSTIKFDDHEYDHITLYHIFDESFFEIIRLLRDPFLRFSKSSNYVKLLELQK